MLEGVVSVLQPGAAPVLVTETRECSHVVSHALRCRTCCFGSRPLTLAAVASRVLQWIDDLACLVCGAGDNDEQLMLCEGARLSGRKAVRCWTLHDGMAHRAAGAAAAAPPVRSCIAAAASLPTLNTLTYPTHTWPSLVPQPQTHCRMRPCVPQLLPGPATGTNRSLVLPGLHPPAAAPLSAAAAAGSAAAGCRRGGGRAGAGGGRCSSSWAGAAAAAR